MNVSYLIDVKADHNRDQNVTWTIDLLLLQ